MTERPEVTERVEGHAGELALAALAGFGVDTMFTLNGGHVWPLYDAAVKRGVRIVDTRHEQTATWAAEGWAKLRREPGLAVLTAGPGVTNGVSAITSAHFNGSPVVVLAGRAPQARWGSGSLQEIDHVPIVASITKVATTVTVIGVDIESAELGPRRGSGRAELQAAVGDDVESGRPLGHADGVIDLGDAHHRAVADPDLVGLGGHGREDHLRCGGVGVLLQEVVLDAPDPVEAELVGFPGLFEGVVVHLPLDPGAERTRRRHLEEDPEAHWTCVAPNDIATC